MSTPLAQVSVPADPAYGRVVRAIADGVAAGVDLPSDLLDDLQLALTEAVGAFIAGGAIGSLQVTLDWDGQAVRCLIAAEADAIPAIDGLRQIVLQGATSTFEVDGAAIRLSVAAS